MTTLIRPLVAGNWKMNGLIASVTEAETIANELGQGMSPGCDVMLCPPATLLGFMARIIGGSAVILGAQDCHADESGAHTGDISAEMLADIGATAIIVGHSERRQDHGESSALVNGKAQAAWRAGLTAIICVGESEAQRDAGQALDIIGGQVIESVPAGATAENTIVAYEPIWAIGTGKTPTTADVAEMHAHIRATLQNHLGDNCQEMRILYGGSVKPANASELMSVANVNGALVGGASLKAKDFLGIISAYT